MTLQEIEEVLLTTSDIDGMYSVQIDLCKRISYYHRLIMEEADEFKKAHIKKDLSWASEMLDVCKRRTDDLRNAASKYHYRFHASAKKILRPEMYTMISEKCK